MKVVIGCVLAVVGLLGVRSVLQDGFRRTITAATKDRAADCLTLAGSTTREYQRYSYIVGSVRNRCETRFDQVTVTFKLDRGSSTLPNATVPAYLRNLKPGETKEFRSAHRIDKNTTFRFDGITGF